MNLQQFYGIITYDLSYVKRIQYLYRLLKKYLQSIKVLEFYVKPYANLLNKKFQKNFIIVM